jgi:tRNA-(ms[2]io[6]A)-hydroxylase
MAPVLAFLRARTPDAWVAAAVAGIDTLLLDHAALELRAAQQAQKLIARYGTAGRSGGRLDASMRLRLLRKLSRLAREELRHFEQVIELLAERQIRYDTVSASRYARELHREIRNDEPGRCVDTLIVGAIIEARSCERFYALLPQLAPEDPSLAKFYASLLRSEARHFEDYLLLARQAAGNDCAERVDRFLDLDATLVSSPDSPVRFHSGPPARVAKQSGNRSQSARVTARPDR